MESALIGIIFFAYKIDLHDVGTIICVTGKT